MTQKTRPVARLMQASARCADLGAAYGQCVLKTYNTIAKDGCAAEFALFKQCVLGHMKR